MGLRTPSRFKTFGAQAQAGAEKQKQARENLMQPGQATKSALGGRASAGTAMVTNTTGAQQAATQNVQETQTQATKDLVVDPTKLGTATVTAIGGTVKPPPATTTTPTTTETPTTPPPVEYTGGLSATDDKDMDAAKNTIIDSFVNAGQVDAIDNTIAGLDIEIANITNQINEINDQISKATAQDAQKLQAEKDRLTKLRDEYVKKRDEENLGQIAGQSQAEIDAQKQAILLAQRDPSNVAKLATVFGKRSAMDSALASQIYGKDLEALQGEAAEALSESERAKIAAGEADEQYVAQLDASKKAYEEKFEDEDRKAELLGMTPEELKGVTQQEVEELFGKDMADRLFDFKDGYISDAQLSKTREILQKNLTAKKELKTKAVTDKDKAQAIANANFDKEADRILGTADSPGEISTQNELALETQDIADTLINHIASVKKSWTRSEWSGISSDEWNAKEASKVSKETRERQQEMLKEIEAAKNRKDRGKFKELYNEYVRYSQQQDKIITKYLNAITNDAYYDSGTQSPQRQKNVQRPY